MMPRIPPAPRFPYTPLFRSDEAAVLHPQAPPARAGPEAAADLVFGSQQPRVARGRVGREHRRRRELDDAALLDHEHLVEARSEEHTSELQSQFHIVCRLLLA